MLAVTAMIELLKELGLWIEDQSIDVTWKLTGKPQTDSRLIGTGDIFICIKGFQSDGHKYITQARQKGAELIIQEDGFQDEGSAIRVSNSRKAAAILAREFYQNPTAALHLIGITGTNGKTTTSLLIRQALCYLGMKTGWIGTLGYITDSEFIPTNNTTPDILELNQILDKMIMANCTTAVMEVSSHALSLDRVYGLKFRAALFINLSREHLDFHRDMNDYFEAKYKLFEYTMASGGTCIVNTDDAFGKQVYERISNCNYPRLISVSGTQGDFVFSNAKCSLNGCEFNLREPSGSYHDIRMRLTGDFNIVNASMAIASVRTLFPDTGTEMICQMAASLKPIKGRLEKVSNRNNIGLYVDYAHTPDAMKKVLQTLKALPHKRLITVFGTGGDRDKGKRPLMLMTALAESDCVIITDDNPRTEKPEVIIKDIIGDCDKWKPWWIIRDRRAAIKAAINLAQAGDIVLLAGKGHETYQEICGVRHHFDDAEVAAECLNEESKISNEELVLPVDPVFLELLYDSEFRQEETSYELYRMVSTDSRIIKSGSLFFALKGDNFDGMNYVDQVLSDRSNGAVVQGSDEKRSRTIRVEDSRQALGMLARKYLLMFHPLKIALTGSTGKTTTKEYLANIFSEEGKILKTEANENNIIGLCRTVFRTRPKDQTAIFELGTNHFGEIPTLSDICNPNIALITNIGPSHLEFFGDEAGVYKEKTELFRRGSATILYPGDDSRFSEFSARGKGVGLSAGCHYRISDVQFATDRLEFKLNGIRWSVDQIVPYYVTNIAFAISCAMEAGLPEESIRSGLRKPIPRNLRMEVKYCNNMVIILDCYNANPVSMQAAIEFWVNIDPGRPHAAILGDMLELGEQSEQLHQMIGTRLSSCEYDLLFTVGQHSKLYHDLVNQINNNSLDKHYDKVEDLLRANWLKHIPDNAVILIKASHGIHLEKLLESICHD